MSNFWDERYGKKEYVYGEEPNVFFAEQLKKLHPGTIILPSEGEGRNAVHAVSQGWKVLAFDSSVAGRAKALQLADKKEVIIEYTVEDAVTINYPENSADAIAFIFAQFPPVTRKLIHQKAIRWLKPGGCIILEAFTPQQLNNNSGGPKELALLYTEDIIKEDFKELKTDLLKSLQTTLKEGKYHKGIADVVQFVGNKK